MARGTARAATSGGGSGIGSLAQGTMDKASQGMEAGMSVLGDLMNDGSTAGAAPVPTTGAPVDSSGVDQFAGKKFEISPVQMKGSFSNKSRENAKGVYGDEDERNNSLKR